MKLTHHGDLLYFVCEACGCRFREAVSKTSLANCGVQQLFPNTVELVKKGIEGCTAAINALSEKKAYKPQPGPELTYVTDCCCGFCDASIFREDLFCRVCGNPVDWSKE